METEDHSTQADLAQQTHDAQDPAADKAVTTADVDPGVPDDAQLDAGLTEADPNQIPPDADNSSDQVANKEGTGVDATDESN